jgi:3' terminal RNA ribose 2'-O-methyltransferase Hen1
MLLTITTTHDPATDLGYLLGKNPARLQSFELSFGRAHVCYPEATRERCTAALILDIDPVGLVRRPQGDEGFALSQYTNDRPYVASSFMSVAIGRVFNQALGGRSRERPDLSSTAIPLEVKLSAVPVRGGETLLRSLFEPLGYSVKTTRQPFDPGFPEWGESPYHTLELSAVMRLDAVLRHLTVVIPVLDDDKHYWVGSEEIDKLLDRGEGWLADHPQRELIARRYLKHRHSLTRDAMRRLTEGEPDADEKDERALHEEEQLEAKLTLNEERMRSVVAVLRRCGAKQVLDLGCGEGKLLRELLREPAFERIVGMDVSLRSVERARARLRLDEMPARQRGRIDVIQGALTYRDGRLEGFDAACLVEVVEHLDPCRLEAFERVVFEYARPSCVVVTTPNADYNVRFENLPAGKFRHRDHRFEWSRSEFRQWAQSVAERNGYALGLEAIGPIDPDVGAPTQMGVFTR